MVLAFAGVSVATMAQDAVPTEKYSVSTNSFWDNWFIQGNVTWNAFYLGSAPDNKMLNTPFYKFGLGTDPTKAGKHPTALGFSVAVGKWFTPGIGLRTKFLGLWLSKAFDKNSQKYLSVNEQAMLNLHNLFMGYDAERFWNAIPFAGLGVARNFDQQANSLVASIGLLNTFRLNDKWKINVELAYYSYNQAFVGGTRQGVRPANRFNQVTLEAGVTYNLGRATWDKTPDVEAIKALSQGQIDALNAQLADAQSENARLKDLLANQQGQGGQGGGIGPVTTVTKVIGAPVSVFFNIGKSNIVSQKDMQNIEAVAEAAKDNNTKILVTGYADSKTGSADFNQALSQKRADAVVDALVNMGVSRDNIETAAAGGVDTLSPISFNRRATVELK